MGVDLDLLDQNGRPVIVPHFFEGSNRPVHVADGGELIEIPRAEASVALTYNYSTVLREIVPGYPGLVDFFHQRRAGDLIPALEAIVAECGTERDPDYWDATPGNVGAIMATILSWCHLHPDAVFDANG